MPPKINSRHEFTTAIDDLFSGNRILTARVPFRFRELDDNREHTVGAGETLFSLAGRFFRGITDRPAGLYWIIADFQPDPIADPTLKISDGTVIVIPSERTVREEIFNPNRRDLS